MINENLIKEALLIRRVEETFLELFAKGKLNGTVHTCVGQEFSAIAFAGQLKSSDFVFSNHRCHGHYISFTKDWKGLLAELQGKSTGVCGGIGSSQHLQNGNFYSNGIQGGIVPVAAGMALANKLKNNDNIGIAYIGDGTLGQGVIYETMNMMSLWNLPLMIVCENNQYAQSTYFKDNLSGEILKRPEAFGIKTFSGDTWNIEELFAVSQDAIDYVRVNKKPAFFLLNTYRLNAHSKGDDDRSTAEISEYREKDFLVKYSKYFPEKYSIIIEEINDLLSKEIKKINEVSELKIEEYFPVPVESKSKPAWSELPAYKERQAVLLNRFFENEMNKNEKIVFIGEDVKSPYGGAFKIAKGLSDKFPERVLTTPISEAAITGIGNGLALAGYKPFIEIMFGDFITLALDQIINHASKFKYMYNSKVNCPLVVRTPMGGGRGYGPTHSQTLDRFLIGIDNVTTVALNFLINPDLIYKQILKEPDPVIVIENKSDYAKYIGNAELNNYKFLLNDSKYPVIKISPIKSLPNLTIVTYGGITATVLDVINSLFYELDLITEVLVLTKISPIDYKEIEESVSVTKKIAVIEEGSTTGGIGNTIISGISERLDFFFQSVCIGSLPVPIPSVKSLENQVLPDKERIIRTIKKSIKISNENN